MKVLYIGNETEDTDIRVSNLANKNNTINHGLVSDPVKKISIDGYYHTTICDLTPSQIIKLSQNFDLVTLLDQPRDSYPDLKSLVTTYRLFRDLDATGISTDYVNNDNVRNLLYWQEFLKENKSFCFHPFVGLINDQDKTVVCGKSVIPIKKIDDIDDWQTDPEYTEIRNKMISGEMMPDRCHDCYNAEREGYESARQFETLEWAGILKADSIEDFRKIKSPYLYEIRPSNKCNLMCRSCDNAHSHLIEREWKKDGTIPLIEWKFEDTPPDKIDYANMKRVYYAGGEPTIMPEFYNFLRRCIEHKNTDFQLLIGTNGMKFSQTLMKLLNQFTNVDLAFSYDGYGLVNDYIRSKCNFDTMVRNGRMLQEHGHRISLQTVFSMWNATRLHEIFEFFDREYPNSGSLMQPARGMGDILLPYNHPRPDLVLESIKRCKKTDRYHMNGRSVKSIVDAMYDHYNDPNYKVDLDQLKKFYEYNDKLDQLRNCRLADYIPELEDARKLLFR